MIQITPKIESFLPFTFSDISWKFHQNPSIGFELSCSQTNSQTNSGKNISSLAELINQRHSSDVKKTTWEKITWVSCGKEISLLWLILSKRVGRLKIHVMCPKWRDKWLKGLELSTCFWPLQFVKITHKTLSTNSLVQ